MRIRRLRKIPIGRYVLLNWEKGTVCGLFWRVGTRKNMRVKGDFPRGLSKGGILEVSRIAFGERHYFVTHSRI